MWAKLSFVACFAVSTDWRAICRALPSLANMYVEIGGWEVGKTLLKLVAVLRVVAGSAAVKASCGAALGKSTGFAVGALATVTVVSAAAGRCDALPFGDVRECLYRGAGAAQCLPRDRCRWVGLAELADVVLTPLFIRLADLSGKMRKVNTHKYAI